jgi:guanosine-3',5'-bis(diphosphate) 3'-pyrophosphohydrolase
LAEDFERAYRSLLEAASFAARAHRHQLRKDGCTPYISHPFRVALVVRQVFGIDDGAVLMAALLHDTIEDTTTDFDDLAEHFGKDIAWWVALLSKDKRLPEAEREKAYCHQVASAPWQVKLLKLADIFDNLMDSVNTQPPMRERSFKRAEAYLAAFSGSLPDPVQAAVARVKGLLESLRR